MAYRDQQTAVYLIAHSNYDDGEQGPFKIGISRDPERRLKALQGSNAYSLKLYRVLWFDTWGEALKVEASEAEDRELWADWNIIAAVTKQSLGEMDKAQHFVAESLSIYRELGSREGELDALLARASIFSTLGRYTESIKEFNRVITGWSGLEGVGEDDPRYFAAAGHDGLADAYTVIGNLALALEHVLQAAARQDAGDQKDRIGPHAGRLAHLERVQEEVLAQYGQPGGVRGAAQVLRGSPEELLLGEHR